MSTLRPSGPKQKTNGDRMLRQIVENRIGSIYEGASGNLGKRSSFSGLETI